MLATDAPSPGPQLLSNARADEAAAAHTIEHEDAPPAKRRRTLTNSSKAAAAAAAAAAAPGPSTASAAAPIAAPRAASAAAPAPAVRADSPGESPEPEADAGPWLTQHTQRGHGSGKSWPPLVKEEAGSTEKPQTGPVAAPAGRGRGAKAAAAAAAAAAADAAAGAASRMVKAEEAALPDVNDASAQTVLELDLFAPKAAAAATPTTIPGAGAGDGDGEEAAAAANRCGEGSEGGARDTEARRPGRLVNYKAFRKQTGQLPAAEVARQPLPVTLVDNFQREDAEAQAFLRCDRVRAGGLGWLAPCWPGR